MGNIKELKDTIEMMTSDDYKERFKAEYYQLCIRLEKLHDMLIKWNAGTLDFEPKCQKSVLTYQENCMIQYKNQLEVRAQVEGIEL